MLRFKSRGISRYYQSGFQYDFLKDEERTEEYAMVVSNQSEGPSALV